LMFYVVRLAKSEREPEKAPMELKR
jgi:hypothetical protein